MRKYLFNSFVKDKDLSSNTKSKISLGESQIWVLWVLISRLSWNKKPSRKLTSLVMTMYKAFLVRNVTAFSESKKVFYSRDVKFDITVFLYQNVLVPRPVSFPVDDLVTTSSIVGDADEFADATTSDISIDLDVDATNQQDELDEKHGTDGEDSCSLEELDLLKNCSESSFSDEIPDLCESSEEKQSGGNLNFLVNQNID